MQGVIRDTEQGPVKGKIESKHYLWAGVPYAAAVTPQTRFKAAEDAPKREAELDCTSFGASAVQGIPGHIEPGPESDDCLFLNIYAPIDASSSKLPVLFWIHGGGFGGGSGATYGGGMLCEEQGLVIVTINYRLAVCGFNNWNAVLNDPKKRFDDNVGMKDQIKALEWVHKNIANFGGDPTKVTIAGESAGGSAVMMLLSAPQLSHLYTQAIIQSGCVSILNDPEASRLKAKHCVKHILTSLQPTLKDEEKIIVDQALQSGDYTHPTIADIIINSPTRLIYDGVGRGSAELEGQIPFGAWFDGVTFPASRREAMNVLAKDKRVIIGHNRDEIMLWTLVLQAPGQPEQVPISERTIMPMLDLLPEAASAAIKKCYDLSKSEGLLQLSTDAMFVNGTRRFAKELAKRGSNVYRYRVDKLAEKGRWIDYTPHGVELLAFWESPWAWAFGGMPSEMGEKSQQLMRHMRDCWGEFVRCGEPGWPRYNFDDHTIALFNCLSPSLKDVKSAFLLPEESPEKVAAWEGYELII